MNITMTNNNSLKATVNFHLLLPQETQNSLRGKFFSASPEKREALWKTFDLDTYKIENTFKKMVKERNKWAKNRGFLSRTEMGKDWFKIPENQFRNFINNSEKIINICNEKTKKFNVKLPVWFYDEFNIPCFICQIPAFHLGSIKEAFSRVTEQNTILKKHRNKISIQKGSRSEMKYEKETGNFTIILENKINNRHQISDLIHELGHVVTYLQCFDQKIDLIEKGVYFREKEAIKIETDILKKLSPDLYLVTLYSETLRLFHRTLFEIEIYENPNQDLCKLYASIFNRCYKAHQQTNPLFILDEHIIFNPFSTLPHTIAHANLIFENSAILSNS